MCVPPEGLHRRTLNKHLLARIVQVLGFIVFILAVVGAGLIFLDLEKKETKQPVTKS